MYQWSQQTWRGYDALGATGDPLTHVASNQFSRKGLSNR